MTRTHRAQSLRMVLVYVAVLLVALCVLASACLFAPDLGAPALTEGSFQLWLGRSGVVALTVAINGVTLASLGGYLIARSSLLRRRRGIGGIFLLQLGPAAIVIAGLSFLLVWLGLIKAFAALLAIYLITGLPFCLWQMCRSYKAVPVEMEESAELDGASVGQSFVRVVLPLAARGLIVSTLFSLVLAWIEYVIAGMLLPNTGIFPPPPATTGESFARQTVVSLVAIVAVTLFLLLGRLLTIRSNRAEPV